MCRLTTTTLRSSLYLALILFLERGQHVLGACLTLHPTLEGVLPFRGRSGLAFSDLRVAATVFQGLARALALTFLALLTNRFSRGSGCLLRAGSPPRICLFPFVPRFLRGLFVDIPLFILDLRPRQSRTGMFANPLICHHFVGDGHGLIFFVSTPRVLAIEIRADITVTPIHQALDTRHEHIGLIRTAVRQPAQVVFELFATGNRSLI